MDWLTNLFQSNILYGLIIGGLGGGLGLLKYVQKYVGKVPISRIRKALKAVSEFTDVIDELKQASHAESEGGENITQNEWNKIYPQGKEFYAALIALRK